MSCARIELGLRPGPRAQIVRDIKQALVSLVDERGVVPIIMCWAGGDGWNDENVMRLRFSVQK